jgi:ribosomal protein L14E/L6E/L27E
LPISGGVFLKRGQIVLSKAGRDCGCYLIVAYTDENGVYVVDGKKRPIDRPKRKSPKHLGATNRCLSEEDFATNRAARKSLRVAVSDEILKGEK